MCAQTNEGGIRAQRHRVASLRRALSATLSNGGSEGARRVARELGAVADYFVKKSVWIIGGDGWAYDIGYGGCGEERAKKDLGLMAMAYGHVCVAQVAMGAKDAQTLCIAHGYDMGHGLEHQKLAVDSGYWPLTRDIQRQITTRIALYEELAKHG